MTFRKMTLQLLHTQHQSHRLISFAKNNTPEIHQQNIDRFNKMCALNGLKVIIYNPASQDYEILEKPVKFDRHIVEMNLEMIFQEMSCPYKN